MTNLIALPSGTELAGDYRIDRVLGAGGFGITYLADEIALDRAVTIKEYFPSDFAARNAEQQAVPRSKDCSSDYRWGLDRFIEEAQTLAKFDHPNIVRVYRYFRANNTGYMVLHFEEGQSLKGWLKGLGRAPRQKELDALIAPLLDALELIHKSDFLHRDIAPDNIIVRKSGQPVLIDFGSARGEIAAHSKTVSALVKPGYSPYEQYAETSRQQGPWSDIYALGATLYHAVTGKRPPDAPSRMVHDEIVPAREAAISSYRPGFLKDIDRALSLEIRDRPQSIPIWRGELLAPEPQRQGWLTRALDKKGGDGAEEPAPGAVRPAAATGTHPPPPDAPGPQGGLLDFVDNLKGGAPPAASARAGRRTAAVAASTDAEALVRTRPPEPVAAKAKRGFAIFGRSNDKPAADGAAADARVEPAAPGPKAKAKAKTATARAGTNPESAADNGARALVPVPLQRRKRARDPKPRPIREASRFKLRPLIVKLAIGAAIASVAVTIQNKLPQLHIESRAIPTSTSEQPASPQIAKIEAHSGGAIRLIYSQDGTRLVSSGADRTLRVWRTGTASLGRTIALDSVAKSVALSGSVALTGHADGRIRRWDIESGALRGTYQRNEADVWSLAFTGTDQRFAAATHDWKVVLWDAKSETTPLHVLEGHDNSVQAIAYSNGGTLLASGGADKDVKLWNLTTLDLVRTYRGGNDFISSIALSSDGKTLAAASMDGSIRIWSTSSSRLRRRLTGHKGAVSGIAFSPDGQRLVSAGADGTVRIWDIGKRRSIRAFAGHMGKVEAVAFSPDGVHVASGGEDGTIRIWATETSRVADRGRR